VKRITCLVGRMRATQHPPAIPIRLATIDPETFLNTASAALTGQPALDLRLDYSRLDQIPLAPRSDLVSLHLALKLLTQNASVPGPVDRIGVLLSDRFDPRPTVLGMMFDIGFNSGVSDPTFNAVPREGCAIFLDAIRALRGDGPAYDQEVGFTTVHEIGHVFNLWHILSKPNFMAQSPSGAVFQVGAFVFDAIQARFLAQVEQTNVVAPGGSSWGVRGTLGPPGDNPFNATPTVSGLRLHISASQEEFWYFEPVELNVRLSAPEPTDVPDVIDPGYEQFDIWIERPDGSRRRYKAPALFCANSASNRVTPRKPFERDISIWGESGGYTFRDAGVHRVFCTLRLGGAVIQSNVVELLVKAAMPRSTRYQRLADTLTQQSNARLLFYKSTRRPSAPAAALTQAARDLRQTPAAAQVRYSVGRALAIASETTPRASRARYQQAGSRALKTALDSGHLSRAKQRRAVSWLDRLRA
jgi:hypothetical protein